MEFPKICADLGCFEFVKWVRILTMDDLDDHQTDIMGIYDGFKQNASGGCSRRKCI